MLIDSIDVTFIGGHGGAGIVSFGKQAKSGPDGGNGGAGGNLYVRATSDITLLNQFSMQTSFAAADGHPGRKKRQSGKDGEDMEITLPIGTSLYDKETKELVAELTLKDQKELICKGGLGGKGNYEFRSAQNTTPKYAQPGLHGQKRNLNLSLKLTADFGLVGLPNAGKSSLLNELTNAKAKVGSYAFTTLSPNLGVYEGKIIADIPGLIEGASEGRGLGISFLKHIEKVGIILHVISSDSATPLKDYQKVRTEMGKYNKKLLQKSEIILITKSDLVDKKEIVTLKNKFKKSAKRVIPVSIYDWESLEKLKKLLNA